jgi:hypothetical protein
MYGMTCSRTFFRYEAMVVGPLRSPSSQVDFLQFFSSQPPQELARVPVTRSFMSLLAAT